MSGYAGAAMIFGRKKRHLTRLLLVEDEPLVAFDNEHILTDADFEIVATVDRVVDAVAVLDSGAKVDLVLADVSLADGSGMDVARAAQRHGVPVLFVTGNCPIEAQELAAGCLTKPYAQRDLIAAIEAVDGALQGKPPRKPPNGLRLFEKV